MSLCPIMRSLFLQPTAADYKCRGAFSQNISHSWTLKCSKGQRWSLTGPLFVLRLSKMKLDGSLGTRWCERKTMKTCVLKGPKEAAPFHQLKILILYFFSCSCWNVVFIRFDRAVLKYLHLSFFSHCRGLCLVTVTQKPVVVSCRPQSFARTNHLSFFSLFLHLKAIFRNIWWFPPSRPETADPHGHICMDLHLKANQGTNSLPISARWGLNCEQEAQIKDKNKRQDRRWASAVEGEQQPRCQSRQITEHQRTRTRIPAVFNRMGSLLPTLQPGLFCCCLINAVFLWQSDVKEVCLITNSVVFEVKWEICPIGF